jgi:hypothetical protein
MVSLVSDDIAFFTAGHVESGDNVIRVTKKDGIFKMYTLPIDPKTAAYRVVSSLYMPDVDMDILNKSYNDGKTIVFVSKNYSMLWINFAHITLDDHDYKIYLKGTAKWISLGRVEGHRQIFSVIERVFGEWKEQLL